FIPVRTSKIERRRRTDISKLLRRHCEKILETLENGRHASSTLMTSIISRRSERPNPPTRPRQHIWQQLCSLACSLSQLFLGVLTQHTTQRTFMHLLSYGILIFIT